MLILVCKFLNYLHNSLCRPAIPELGASALFAFAIKDFESLSNDCFSIIPDQRIGSLSYSYRPFSAVS